MATPGIIPLTPEEQQQFTTPAAPQPSGPLFQVPDYWSAFSRPVKNVPDSVQNPPAQSSPLPGTIPLTAEEQKQFKPIPLSAEEIRQMKAADPYYFPITRENSDTLYDEDKTLGEKVGNFFQKDIPNAISGSADFVKGAWQEGMQDEPGLPRLKRVPATLLEGAARSAEWLANTGAQFTRWLRDGAINAIPNADIGIPQEDNTVANPVSEEQLKEQYFQRQLAEQKFARGMRGLPDQKSMFFDPANPPDFAISPNVPADQRPYEKGADIVSMVAPLPGLGLAKAARLGEVAKAVEAGKPVEQSLGQKIVAGIGGAAEKAGAAAESAGQFPRQKVRSLAEDFLGKQLSEKALHYGEVVGLLHPVTAPISQVALGLEHGGQYVKGAGQAAKAFAEANPNNIVPRLVQVASNPNAPKWLRTTAESLNKIGADKAVQFGTGIAGSALKGAAAGTALGLATDQDSDNVAQFAVFGGAMGAAGRAFSKVVGTDAAMRRTQMAVDAKQRFLSRALAPMEQGGMGLTPEQAGQISDFAQVNAQYVHDLSRGTIKFQFHSPEEISTTQKGSVAYYDPIQKTVHLPFSDPTGRILHELPHAISDALGSDGKSRLLIDAAFTPDQLAALRSEYAARFVNPADPKAADPAAVKAMMNQLDQSSDKWIYDEISADAGYGALLKNVERSGANFLPDILGRNKTLLDRLGDRVRAKYLNTFNSWFHEDGSPAVPSKALFSDPEVYHNPELRKLLYAQLRSMSKQNVKVKKLKNDEAPPIGVPESLIGKHEVAPKEWADENKILDPKASAKLDREKAAEGKKISESPVRPKGDTTPEIAPRLDPLTGEKVTQGTKISDALEKMPHYGNHAKKIAQIIESVIGSGKTMDAWYFPVHKKGKLAPGGDLPATNPVFAPDHFVIDSKGHVLVVGLSVEAADKKIARWADEKKLEKYWAGDADAFRVDLMQYLRNHAEGKPGETDLGGWANEKKHWLDAFVAGQQKKLSDMNPVRKELLDDDKGGILRSYRLDRISTIKPGAESGWQMEWDKKKKNFSPAAENSHETDEQITPEGLTLQGKTANLNTNERSTIEASKDGGALEKGKGLAAADVISQAARANAEAGIIESDRQQKTALEDLHARGESVVTPNPSRTIGEGNEHVVEASADGTRVLKHTKGAFGYTLQVHTAPFGSYVSLRDATPEEYIQRIHNSNKLFADDARIEGVSKLADAVGLTISQRSIEGGEPSEKEVADFMKSNGFTKVSADAIDNDYLADKIWFDPHSGYIVTDVKLSNFKKTPAGDIVPIDLIVQHALPGSELEKAVKFGISNNKQFSPSVDNADNLGKDNNDENVRAGNATGTAAPGSIESAADDTGRISSAMRQSEPNRTDYSAGVEALLDYADKNKKFLPKSVIPSEFYSRGQEHEIWLSQDGKRVLKATYPNEFGFDIRTGQTAAPQAYLKRLDLANKVFADDIRLEGVVVDGGRTRIITSQPYIRGEAPGKPEIADFMREHEFEPVVRPLVSAWYRAKDNVLVSDAQPKNFIKSTDGQVVPIDVNIENPNEVYRKKIVQFVHQPKQFSPSVILGEQPELPIFDRKWNELTTTDSVVDYLKAEHGVVGFKPSKEILDSARKAMPNTRITDAAGNPLVVYHGTRKDFSNFDLESLGLATGAPSAKEGFFFSRRPQTASSYTELANLEERPVHDAMVNRAAKLRVSAFRSHSRDPERMAVASEKHKQADQLYEDAYAIRTAGGNVMPVFLNLENPSVIDMGGKAYREKSFFDLIKQAKATGNDGLVIKNTFDQIKGDAMPDDVIVAFKPEQIKSAISNNGEFSAANSDIRFSPAVEKPPTVLYHGTKEKFSDDQIATGKRMFGIHLTTDPEAAKEYGDVKKYNISPDAKILDLSDGSDLWSFMLKHEVVDKDQAQDVDLENYAQGGKLFQYDISSKTHLADRVARRAKALGYSIVKMPDDLGGKGENVAYVVTDPKVLQGSK